MGIPAPGPESPALVKQEEAKHPAQQTSVAYHPTPPCQREEGTGWRGGIEACGLAAHPRAERGRAPAVLGETPGLPPGAHGGDSPGPSPHPSFLSSL